MCKRKLPPVQHKPFRGTASGTPRLSVAVARALMKGRLTRLDTAGAKEWGRGGGSELQPPLLQPLGGGAESSSVHVRPCPKARTAPL